MVMFNLYRIKPNAGAERNKLSWKNGVKEVEKIRCLETEEPQEFEQNQKI